MNVFVVRRLRADVVAVVPLRAASARRWARAAAGWRRQAARAHAAARPAQAEALLARHARPHGRPRRVHRAALHACWKHSKVHQLPSIKMFCEAKSLLEVNSVLRVMLIKNK